MEKKEEGPVAQGLDLEAIEARCEAATPGPWYNGQAQDGERMPDGTGYAGDFYDTDEVMAKPSEIDRINPDLDAGGDGWFLGQIQHEGDRAFIIHARQDIPALIARVRALEARSSSHPPVASGLRGEGDLEPSKTREPSALPRSDFAAAEGATADPMRVLELEAGLGVLVNCVHDYIRNGHNAGAEKYLLGALASAESRLGWASGINDAEGYRRDMEEVRNGDPNGRPSNCRSCYGPRNWNGNRPPFCPNCDTAKAPESPKGSLSEAKGPESSPPPVSPELPPSSDLREAARFYTDGYGNQDTPEERARFYAEAHNRLADALAATPAPLVGAREALVKAVIPLEAIVISGRIRDLGPDLQQAVHDGIAAINATLKEDPAV